MPRRAFYLFFLLFWASAVGARDAAAPASIGLDDDLAPVLAQQRTLAAEIRDGRGGWEALSEGGRREVFDRQARLLALIDRDDVRRLADLSPAHQVEAINLLESLRAAQADADDDRMICTREEAVGSRFPKRTCRTVGERRREREAVRDGIRNGNSWQRRPPRPRDL